MQFTLTQKIFFIFLLLLFAIINSWAFTLSTVLDVRDSFDRVQYYAFPSITTTSQLKDEVHTALLNVYDYVSTGNPESKERYQEQFNNAIRSEYALFDLSQTPNDFAFTQEFNDKLLAIYSTADELVQVYERDPNSQAVANELSKLNALRDDFNQYLNIEITQQITGQVTSTNESIASTVKQIQWYVMIVSGIVLLIVIYIAYFINHNIKKPVETLTEAARRFGKGNFKKVNINRKDELGLFAKTFNTMATDIEATQQALREELEKTKQLDRQKSEFLSIAAHQLRTPISGIRWVNQMVYDGDLGDLNEDQKYHIGKGLENINRMVKLINDLLDVTKIEEQTYNYDFAVADMRELASATVENLSSTAEQRKVRVLLHFEPDSPLPLEVDAEKIQLAINNLVDNAIKYSEEEGIVDVTVKDTGKDLEVTIHDNGIGIPEESQKELFTKFFRAANAMKVFADGSGLGLFIVKDVVEKHHGTVTYASNKGKGSTFTITLPKKQSQKKHSRKNAQKSNKKSAEKKTAEETKK